jgi:hypothetical protein
VGIILKLTLKEQQDGVEWTDVAQDRDERRDVVITVMGTGGFHEVRGIS